MGRYDSKTSNLDYEIFDEHLNWSAYRNLKGETVKWLTTDDESMRADCIKKYGLNKCKTNIYWDADIEYKINSQGFRSPEFTSEPTIAFLGCSVTVGIGLPVEDTFAYKVSNNLNLRMANLGMGGGSADSSFRIASYWLRRIKPRIVFHQVPQEGRLEFIMADGAPSQVGWWNENKRHTNWLEERYSRMETKFLKDYFRNMNQMNQNIKLNFWKNRMGVKQLAESIGAVFIEWTAGEDVKKIYDSEPLNLRGRDLQHPGKQCHETFAQVVTEKILRKVKEGKNSS